MKDKIEDFIERNRSGFDDLEPNMEHWSKIESELGKSPSNYSWLWKVAAVVLLCLSIGLLYERTLHDQSSSVLSESEVQDEELQQVELYYTTLIREKRSEIALVVQQQNFHDIDLLEDLDALDQMYLDLKSDLEKNQNNERLINAMIRNLQLRVEILNRQLKILEQLRKYENEEVII